MVYYATMTAQQVYTQPVFQLMEARLAKFMGRPAAPLMGRAMLRLVYVLLITFVAILVPFFHALMGLIGAGRWMEQHSNILASMFHLYGTHRDGDTMILPQSQADSGVAKSRLVRTRQDAL